MYPQAKARASEVTHSSSKTPSNRHDGLAILATLEEAGWL